jgi:flagellar biosynthesis/type III secretory pathway ATPase
MWTDIEVIDAVTRLEGPLLFLRRTVNAGLNEAVEVEDSEGHVRLGRVVALDEDIVTVEVLESTAGLGLSDTRVRFLGEPPHFSVGPEILGRVFDGVGRAIDGGPPVSAEKSLRIDGLPIRSCRSFRAPVCHTTAWRFRSRSRRIFMTLPRGSSPWYLSPSVCPMIPRSISAVPWKTAGRWSMPRCSSIWHQTPVPSVC